MAAPATPSTSARARAKQTLSQQLAGLDRRYRWVEEYVFAPVVDGRPIRRWRFDFACPSQRLAVEVEGSLFTGGRHGGTPSAIRDLHKYNAAVVLGWRVVRVEPKMIANGRALTLVRAALRLHVAALGAVLDW